MPGDAPEVRLDLLERRRVRRAGLILHESGHSMALDADRGEFVFLPALRPGLGLLSLSHDGRSVLLREHDASTSKTLCVMTLAEGEEQWFSAPRHEDYQHAVLSPDGTVIAVIATDDGVDTDVVFVSLIDVRTGEHRRIWQGEGAAPLSDVGVCWSPDGRLIAASYLYWDEELDDDDQFATVVIDRSGKALASRKRSYALNASNAAWAGDRELLCLDEFDDASNPRYVTIDAATGDVRFSEPYAGILEGVVAGRRIHRVAEYEAPSAQVSEYYTTDMDGQDRRPLFTLSPRLQPRLHIAPELFIL
ncbi:hypothetical protein GCM10009550_06330 [Actinocorallia libanotica]|uniref:WD40 repeat protein n=2 Tax=Actinocorallia libanotica TaxID=46162 RepID=A0ABN1Q749_9ACTN